MKDTSLGNEILKWLLLHLRFVILSYVAYVPQFFSSDVNNGRHGDQQSQRKGTWWRRIKAGAQITHVAHVLAFSCRSAALKQDNGVTTVVLL